MPGKDVKDAYKMVRDSVRMDFGDGCSLKVDCVTEHNNGDQ